MFSLNSPSAISIFVHRNETEKVNVNVLKIKPPHPHPRSHSALAPKLISKPFFSKSNLDDGPPQR